MIPSSEMDCLSSSRDSSENCFRGCSGEGMIWSRVTCITASPGWSSTRASGCESEVAPLMRAPSPFPNAFFAIGGRIKPPGGKWEALFVSLR